MGVHVTSQASGYGLTHRMIAGLSLGPRLLAVAADLYTMKRDESIRPHNAVTNSLQSGGATDLMSPPKTEQQPMFCFELGSLGL